LVSRAEGDDKCAKDEGNPTGHSLSFPFENENKALKALSAIFQIYLNEKGFGGQIPIFRSHQHNGLPELHGLTPLSLRA
jgi:hypothetical protein